MRAVVFGYHNVGDRCLRVLDACGVEVVLVVTHTDRPDERQWFRRVADTAVELGLSFVYCDDPTEPGLAECVRAVRPDVIFSFYYRAIIPARVLTLARQGAYNMHGSLLPRYRGRVPVNWAVLHGETETGATLHVMESRADAGAIVDQTAVPILPDDTAADVFEKVTVAAELTLWRVLPSMLAGDTPRHPNKLEDGSYFPGRTPEDGLIDWTRPAAEVYNLIRAVAPPYPGAFTRVAGRRLIVAKARRPLAAMHARFSLPEGTPPGLHVSHERLVGLCGDGGLILIHSLLVEGEPAPLTPIAFRQLLAGQAVHPDTSTSGLLQ